MVELHFVPLTVDPHDKTADRLLPLPCDHAETDVRTRQDDRPIHWSWLNERLRVPPGSRRENHYDERTADE
jgi:hypothetical protein